MKYKNKTDLELLIRIIEGKTFPDDIKIFDEWLNQSDANVHEYESMKLLWGKTNSYIIPEHPNPDLMWNNIQEKINNIPIIVKDGFDYSWIIKIAAIILVAVSGII